MPDVHLMRAAKIESKSEVSGSMVNFLNKSAYENKFEKHVKEMPFEDAVKYHVGGIERYYVIGAIECRLMEMEGLSNGNYLIDLGCGSGRLAGALRSKFDIKYLGLEIVERLVAHCRTQIPDYRFEVPDGFSILERDGQADFVTAFSLFTHLLHEQTYLYIKDARRVLKPGGKLILSFLEYRIAAHRTLFLGTVRSSHLDRPLVVFNDREGLNFYAESLGFSDIRFIDGTEKIFDFPNPVKLPDGVTISGDRSFGQSICVMTK